jgi:hypothetical protein
MWRQLAFPQDESLRFGYVLRGGIENPRADDSTSCMSKVSNIRLEVTYTVPQS